MLASVLGQLEFALGDVLALMPAGRERHLFLAFLLALLPGICIHAIGIIVRRKSVDVLWHMVVELMVSYLMLRGLGVAVVERG